MSRQFVSLMANRNLKYPYEWEPWLDQAYLEGMGLRNLEWDISADRSEINVICFTYGPKVISNFQPHAILASRWFQLYKLWLKRFSLVYRKSYFPYASPGVLQPSNVLTNVSSSLMYLTCFVNAFWINEKKCG